MNGPTLFDLSSVFSAVAGAVPDHDMLVWTVGLENERHWPALYRVVGRPEWKVSERYIATPGRADKTQPS